MIPYGLMGLAVALTFRMNLFNMGVDGQLYLGAIGATYISMKLGDAPHAVAILATLAFAILAAELLGELGMGILMKAIPQINAFVINIELKVIIGLVLLFLFLNPINEFLLGAESEMLDSMSRMLQIIAAPG